MLPAWSQSPTNVSIGTDSGGESGPEHARFRQWPRFGSGRGCGPIPGGPLEASGQRAQGGGGVASAAEALREALECEAYFRLAKEVYPEAEFMVLRESPLGQVR